jgi:hypothetical protein
MELTPTLKPEEDVEDSLESTIDNGTDSDLKIVDPETTIENIDAIVGFEPDTSAASKLAEPITDSSEPILSDMAGSKSYVETRFKADNQEIKRRNKAIEASLYGSRRNPREFLETIKGITNAPLTKRTTGEAVTNVIGTKLDKDSRKIMSNGIDVASGQQINKAGIAKNLNFAPGEFDTGMNTPNPIIKSVANHFNNKEGADKVETPSDWLAFANPIGGASPDGMDIDFWDTMFSVFKGDFDSESFNKKMESNWGEDWEWRWAGFLAKEVAVDVGILALAATIPPLAGIVALSQVGLKANLIAGIARTGLIATGGTGAQYVQDQALGRETDVSSQMLGRAIGQAGGEVLGQSLKAGYKAFKGRTSKEANALNAAEDGTKPLTKKQLRAALSPDAEVSVHSTLTRAELEEAIDGYKKVNRDVTEKLTDPNLPPDLRSNLAAHLGVDESRLGTIRTDIVLPMLKNQNETLIKKSQTIPLIKRQGQEYTALKELEGIYFQDKVVQLRATDTNINKSSIPVLNSLMKFAKIAEPTKLAFQSASNWLTTKNFIAKQTRGFQRMYEEVESGLANSFTAKGKQERQMLNAIAKEGDANETVFNFTTVSPKELAGKTIPANVQTAYRKLRAVNDFAYEIADAGAVSTLKDSVFKYNNKFVQIDKQAKNLADFKSKEKIKVREFDNNTMQPSGKTMEVLASTLRKDANKIDTIINYRTGHIPRVYRNQRFSVIGYSTTGKRLSFEATFDSNKQATEYLLARKAQIEAKNSDEIIVKVWNKTDTGAGAAHTTRQSAKLINQLDEATAEAFRKQMIAQGIDADKVSVLMQEMTPGKLVPGASKARSIGVATTKEAYTARLNLAKNPSSKEAQEEFSKIIAKDTPMTSTTQLNYYSSVANNSGYDNWRKFAFDDFAKRYKELDQIDPLTFDPSVFKNTLKELSPIVKEATQYSNWIKRTIKDSDLIEKTYDNALETISDRLALKAANGSFAASTVSKIIDKLIPEAKSLENSLRFVAAFPKLLTFNTAQVVVQGSQAVLSAGAAFGFNPRLAVGSMYKLARISGVHTARRLEMRLPKSKNLNDARSVHQEMVESGYFADLNSTDIMFGMKHNLDPGAVRKSIGFMKTVLAAPFRGGEAINRAMAYVTVRDQIAYAIGRAEKEGFGNLSDSMKRLASDFDGRPMLKADIGGTAFREAVVEKASILALNMGKAGELELLSGSFSVPFQFKQVLAKEISVIDSTALTLREKVVGAGSMISMFGAGAIPLAGDLMKMGDVIARDVDDPTSPQYFTSEAKMFSRMLADDVESLSGGLLSTEGVQRFFAKGAITAATEGEIDFANRVALGNFISETWDVQDGFDVVVSIAVLRDMKDAAVKLGGGMLNPISYLEVLGRVVQGEDFKEILIDKFDPESTAGKLLNKDIELGTALLSLARESGKVFSQVGSVSRELDAAYKDLVAPESYWDNPLQAQTYSTSGLRPLPVERTRMRDIQLRLGITPGKIVEEYSKQKTERIYTQAIKEFQKDLTKRFIAARDSRAVQNRIAKDAVNKLVELRLHLEEMNIDGPTPRDAMRSVHKKLAQLVIDY